MNCPEARLLIHAYADGELDLVRSVEMERHLEACAACKAEAASLKALRSSLRNSELVHRAPASLRKKVRAFARQTEGGRVPGGAGSTWLWKWLALGAATCAALAILVRPAGVSDHDLLVNEAVSGHIRSLMAGHLTDVASTDQHTVKPWFNGKLDFAPDVKDFAAKNFPLIGGRLDYLDGHPVAALVYRRNKHLINVFVWPVAGGGETGPKTESRRGYIVINREARGLHYCLVSDLNEKELSELAELL